MFFVFLLFLFSCGQEFNIVRVKHNANAAEILDKMHFFMTKKNGFSLTKEKENSIEFVRELLKSPEFEGDKKVNRSKAMFVNIYVDSEYIYAKPTLIKTTLNLRKDKELKEKNVRKAALGLESVDLKDKEGLILFNVLSNVLKDMKIKSKIESINEKKLSDEVALNLIPSYMGG